MKLKALDLFCCGGGACIGLQQAGFEVYGIDIEKHKNYPGHFIQADIRNLPVDVMDFDFVWASPPCQAFSTMTAEHAKSNHPNFVPITREILKNHPYYAIENVPGAPVRPDVVLVGHSVGLKYINRKRIFELPDNIFIMTPPISRVEKHDWRSGKALSITTSLSASAHYYRRKALGLNGRASLEEAKDVMGIPQWHTMTRHEIGESIPPAYSRFIAERMRPYIERGKT